jgi:hypothetical protein
MKTMKASYPTQVKDRFEVYRFFNGISTEGKIGLDMGRSRVPLVKSFLLEHVSGSTGRQPLSPDYIFKHLGAQVHQIDESFMEIRSRDISSKDFRTVGYLEKFSERFFSYYTCEDSQEAKRRVNRWITSSPDLDSAWFSAFLLQRLWHTDVSKRGSGLFSKLTFMHESIFEMPEDATDEPENRESEDNQPNDDDNDDSPTFDRRKARFQMADRIGQICASLANLQKYYTPLNALYALRFPSVVAHGSHDLYQEGRLTNRSSSFEEHRNMVRYLYRTYNAVLNNTEKTAWHSTEALPGKLKVNIGAKGVPLVIKFREELSEQTFKFWISRAFQKRNRFRLWGEPIWLGPTKVHVYGADRHLWQPINMEFTSKGLVAILPQGTCGNTFHRLVTNIQTYVCPAIDAWLGAEEFNKVVDNSIDSSGGYIDEH